MRNGLQPLSNVNLRFPSFHICEEKNRPDAPGLKEWIFCPGMLFQAMNKWWGDRGRRDRPHEGLDLLLYKDQKDRILRLDEETGIPVMGDGIVVGIIKDFLGRSIIVEHLSSGADRIYTIYGHTRPHRRIHAGTTVRQGDILATVAGPGRSAFPMAPHVHISIARPFRPIPYERLNWDTMGASDTLGLLDPLQVMDRPYRILEGGDPVCRTL